MEALASGNFIITTPVGAIPEIIEEGLHGVYINVRDPQDLSQKMAWAIEHIKIIRELGMKNREYAYSNFEADVVIQDIKNIYNHLLRLHD